MQLPREGNTNSPSLDSGSEYDSSDDSFADSEYSLDASESRVRRFFKSPRKLKRVAFFKVHILSRGINIWIILCLLLVVIYFIGHSVHPQHMALSVEKDMTDDDNFNSHISKSKISSGIDKQFQAGCREPNVDQPRANAAFVVLARNTEVQHVIKSMQSMERHFNQWFNYPWVFLNDEPFTDEFKNSVVKHTSADVEFGTIPTKEWDFDENIDKDELLEYIASQGDRKIMYGNLESYHKMCRFYSGFFYKHELVKKRDWYWRVEPNVEFFCDLTYDPFVEMESNGKKYGFTVMINELYYTIPGLFKETKAFVKKQGIKVGSAWKLFVQDYKYTTGKNLDKYDGLRTKEDILRQVEINVSIEKFLSMKDKQDKHVGNINAQLMDEILYKSTQKPNLYEDRFDMEEYNMCHFWSNFEIARTDLFTSPEYQAYFEHLDASGGFYKERWGDAPVHSLAVGMMLNKEDIHYFRDIGYQHSNLAHCPRNHKNQLEYKPAETYLKRTGGEKYKYWKSPDVPNKNGVGCRCRCPKRREIEDSVMSCIGQWAELTSTGYITPQPLDLDYWEAEISHRLDKYLNAGGELGESDIVGNLLL